MAFASRGNLVLLGMILSGIALGAYVLASWPDTTPRLIRLPYGESMPKTPRVVPERTVRVLQAVPAAPEVAVAPVPAPKAVKPARKAPIEDEIVSEESPYDLGAEPLPGTVPAITESPPASGQG